MAAVSVYFMGVYELMRACMQEMALQEFSLDLILGAGLRLCTLLDYLYKTPLTLFALEGSGSRDYSYMHPHQSHAHACTPTNDGIFILSYRVRFL